MFNLIQPVYAQGSVSLKTTYGFGWIGSLSEALGRLTGPAFAIAAVAVAFYFLIGAIKYLTSAGDKNAVASGRDMITHAIIGFMMLIFLFLILQYLPGAIGVGNPLF